MLRKTGGPVYDLSDRVLLQIIVVGSVQSPCTQIKYKWYVCSITGLKVHKQGEILVGLISSSNEGRTAGQVPLAAGGDGLLEG
jgi:hypothetical protein